MLHFAAKAAEPPWISIVVLNYNNWGDTIECLESLLRLDYPHFEIVVCDNGSADGSVSHLCAWARGELLPVSRHPCVARDRGADWPSSLSFQLVRPQQAHAPRLGEATRLFILPTGRNGGFSFGNNVGIRFAQNRSDVAAVWLLNNDTAVEAGALSALVRHMQADPTIGICGSTLYDFEPPSAVQALGGARYRRWRAGARMLFATDFPDLGATALAMAVRTNSKKTLDRVTDPHRARDIVDPHDATSADYAKRRSRQGSVASIGHFEIEESAEEGLVRSRQKERIAQSRVTARLA